LNLRENNLKRRYWAEGYFAIKTAETQRARREEVKRDMEQHLINNALNIPTCGNDKRKTNLFRRRNRVSLCLLRV
jgi:hypothetical protein